MNFKSNWLGFLIAAIVVGGLIAAFSDNFAPSGDPEFQPLVDVRLPALSEVALIGQEKFNGVCAACHGKNGTGTTQGPPLIHDIYNPGHHADEAFFRAARNGVRAHHWRFGNMPVQDGVSDQDLLAIVQFIREVQLANGITYRQHNM